jgi:hypothetical protein
MILPSDQMKQLFSPDLCDEMLSPYKAFILDAAYRRLRDRKYDYRKDRLTVFGNTVGSLIAGKRSYPVEAHEVDMRMLRDGQLPKSVYLLYHDLHHDFRTIRSATRQL